MSYSRLNPLALGTNPSGASCIQKIDAELENVFASLNGLDSALAAKPDLVAGRLPLSILPPTATPAETAAQTAADRLLTPASLTGLDLALTRDLGHGECRLDRASATSLKLSPLGRGLIMVKTDTGWTARRIGGDGLLLEAASIVNLSPGATYYVYACAKDAGLALEASTIGHAKDADTGVEVKAGDPTRTLVGMARTNASTQFQDDGRARLVASWFKRRLRSALGVLAANRGTASPSFVEATLATERPEILTWAGEQLRATSSGYGYPDNNWPGYAGIGIDSPTDAATFTAVGYGITQGNIACSTVSTLAEGYHYGALLFKNANGYGFSLYGGCRVFLEAMI